MKRSGTVCLDMSLFIRLLEAAREDLDSDEALHELAERCSELAGENSEPLSMEDYKDLIPKATPSISANLHSETQALTAAAMPSWFAEFKATVVAMGGTGRALLFKVTPTTVTIRYQSKRAVQDLLILMRLTNLCRKHKIAMIWSSDVRGLYVTFGPAITIEEKIYGN